MIFKPLFFGPPAAGLAKPFLVATGNPGKFSEICAVLEGLPYQFKSLADLGEAPDQVEEIGATHEENALLKARHFFEKTGWMTLGEDSGLEVDALKGELGLHTRRWGAGSEASDEAWLDYFLKRMAEFPAAQRTARFVCLAALVMSRVDGNGAMDEKIFYGAARGVIVLKPEAPTSNFKMVRSGFIFYALRNVR